MWWIISNFLHAWLTFSLAGLCLVGAAVAYFRLPLFGKEAAIILVAVAVGLWAYSAGFSARADMDKSAELQITISTLKQDVANAKAAAEDERQRAAELEQANSESTTKVADYERELAARKGDSCGLNDDDLRRVRGIDGSGAH